MTLMQNTCQDIATHLLATGGTLVFIANHHGLGASSIAAPRSTTQRLDFRNGPAQPVAEAARYVLDNRQGKGAMVLG